MPSNLPSPFKIQLKFIDQQLLVFHRAYFINGKVYRERLTEHLTYPMKVTPLNNCQIDSTYVKGH